MDDDSICSLVLHHNAPKFLVHIRDGCLRKAAGSSSPGTDVSNNVSNNAARGLELGTAGLHHVSFTGEKTL